MTRNSETQTVKLKGNVQVVFQKHYLSAKEAVIHLKTKQVIAKGKVELQNEKVYAEARKLVLNYETKTGTLYNAFVQSGQVVFTGEVVEKTGENTFIATDGSFTACNTCPPAWSFKGSEIKAEIGAYADIWYPTLKIGGFSVLWLPRIIFPLKSQRQSGFLEPRFGSGSLSGFSIEIPYFWAISRNKDLSASVRWYQLRGVKALGEYRFVLSDLSRGQLNAAYIDDKVFRDREDDENQNIQRGFTNYNHYFALPNDIIQRAELRYVSDLRYTRDFSLELEGHGDPALENKVSLTKNLNSQHLSLETAIYTNLLQENALATNENAVHRFPTLRYSLADQRIFNTTALIGMDLDYTNFARENFAYDDVADNTLSPGSCTPIRDGEDPPDRCIKAQRDGSFDPDQGDLIRAGHRLDVTTRISTPFRWGNIVEVIPRVSFRETQYRFNVETEDTTAGYSNSAARRYVQTDLEFQTMFSHVFGDLEDPKSWRLKHVIEPRVGLSAIPWFKRANHPFFGEFSGQSFSRTFERITDEDFFGINGVQFDYNDRIFDKRLLNFSLTHRFTRKSWEGANPVYSNVVLWRLTQSYDFDEFQRQNPRPWSTLISELRLKFRSVDALSTVWYFPYANVANSSTRVRLVDLAGDFFELSFTNALILENDNTRFTSYENRVENLGLGMGFVHKYFNFVGRVNFETTIENDEQWLSPASWNLLSWEYFMTIKPPGECWGIEVGHAQQIGNNEVQLRFNLSFDFGGESANSLVQN